MVGKVGIVTNSEFRVIMVVLSVDSEETRKARRLAILFL